MRCIIFILFLTLIALALPAQTQAQIITECLGFCGSPWPGLCPSWTEYRCGEEICPGAEIQTRQQIGYPYCDGSLSATCYWSCEYKPTPWVTESVGQPWQICVDDDSLRTKPDFACSGQCLETPQNPRYYDNPTYSDRPDKNLGNNNLRLPVKFDWDDVTGWQAEPDGPKSYLLKLNAPEGGMAKVLNISEYGSLRQDKGACFLKSNSAYSWQTQACCSADGQNCGKANSWDFTTNPAPEPVSPYDPDWAGEGSGQNVSVPATLDWCDIEEANSYVFRAYVMQGGQKICHPNLFATKAGQEFCEPWIARKQRRDAEQLEKTLFSDFLDPDLYFFTGDTTYLWETAVCADDNGLECSDQYSQQWGFTTSPKELPGAFLVSPPNDPSGQKPVGLPLILDWRKDEGINSWRYKINSKEAFTDTSQSRSLDFPELSLNTFYKWQALSCLDYRGEKCESPWSDIYTFKTTGQPPNLIYPNQEAAGVIIPVKFDWEDVPGAKSYVFKIQGDGLDLEKTTDKSEFSLDYPDLKMLANYSWHVKTCAREEGRVCGDYSASQNLQTFKLPAPQKPSPANEGGLPTDVKLISWESVAGAKAYQYQIRYLSLAENEINETCQSLAGKEILNGPKTVLMNSDFTELNCLGDYQWQVRTCLDEACEEKGEWANWTFTLVEPGELSGLKGLIPCGQSYNNPDTPWNERESCQINHLFLLMKVIIDFFLFKVVPLILIILTIISGLMLYFSLGKAAALAGVMSLWKSAIIGLFIIFLAWTMINLFLKLTGYQVGIFGNWYEF